PTTGHQWTLESTPDAATVERLGLLLGRADAGECDVVVKEIIGGEARGALYVGAGAFRSDRAADAVLSTAALLALAAIPGQEQTFTAVLPGNGRRAAIDRDLDGALSSSAKRSNLPRLRRPHSIVAAVTREHT